MAPLAGMLAESGHRVTGSDAGATIGATGLSAIAIVRRPRAAAFTNVGPALPIANAASVTLNQNVTFQFRPGGLTQTTVGVPTLILDCHGSKETIAVSTYGNITVTP